VSCVQSYGLAKSPVPKSPNQCSRRHSLTLSRTTKKKKIPKFALRVRLSLCPFVIHFQDRRFGLSTRKRGERGKEQFEILSCHHTFRWRNPPTGLYEPMFETFWASRACRRSEAERDGSRVTACAGRSCYVTPRSAVVINDHHI
jgi:hypothetical protein